MNFLRAGRSKLLLGKVVHVKKIMVIVSALLFLVAVAGLSAAPAEELEAKGKEIAAKLKAAEDDVGSQQFRNALEAFHKGDAGALAGIRDLYFCDKGLMDALPVRAAACALLNTMHALLKSEQKKTEQSKVAAEGGAGAPAPPSVSQPNTGVPTFSEEWGKRFSSTDLQSTGCFAAAADGASIYCVEVGSIAESGPITDAVLYECKSMSVVSSFCTGEAEGKALVELTWEEAETPNVMEEKKAVLRAKLDEVPLYGDNLIKLEGKSGTFSTPDGVSTLTVTTKKQTAKIKASKQGCENCDVTEQFSDETGKISLISVYWIPSTEKFVAVFQISSVGESSAWVTQRVFFLKTKMPDRPL